MPGSVIVICGPMFSGKTTELIARVDAMAGQGCRCVLIKPAGDRRYAVEQLVTHDGGRAPAVEAANAEEVLAIADGGSSDWAYDVVGIDEAHFFGESLTAVCRALAGRGAVVFVAGVERDHRGRPFEPFPSLLCEADEVVKRAGACAVCGGPSVHSQRLVESSERIVVGGAESYEPRCRVCFRPGA